MYDPVIKLDLSSFEAQIANEQAHEQGTNMSNFTMSSSNNKIESSFKLKHQSLYIA